MWRSEIRIVSNLRVLRITMPAIFRSLRTFSEKRTAEAAEVAEFGKKFPTAALGLRG
jgi:hypothetical protein